MSDINPQLVFDFIHDNGGSATFQELMKHFEDFDHGQILRPAESLVNDGWLKSHNDRPAWSLTERARTKIAEAAQKAAKDAILKDLEEEKLRTDLALAKLNLRDYKRTRIIAWAGLIVALISAVAAFFG